ncbi:SigB/SigF/SigG family RNA polymerase sigma factor [Actinocorallia longicatena]|uniref:SigB/SigF/SigG family RNA polymerase sigma factor n=1 Tax=Actinocorallia longicatena TaxID=111803 RepID=A0ABP6Q6I4_9ACTN
MTTTLTPPEQTDAGKLHDLIEERLVLMASLEADDPRRARIREEVVVMCDGYVRRMASRFGGRGENPEDLYQVGMLGLVKAVDRFDPDRGVHFAAFAGPTVLGEIKRHFRDRSWALRPPRRIQELHLAVNKARVELSQTLHKAPTVADLAAHVGVSEEEVLETLAAGDHYNTVSLDSPIDDDSDRAESDMLGRLDPAFELVEGRNALGPALERLPERERRIVLLRFYANKSQSEIATELGISQMHVSRLLSRSLGQLRTLMEG